MENKKKNIPERLCIRLNYKFLRYGDIYDIEGKDTLIFNYVLNRSQKTEQKKSDGSFVYENHSLSLGKVEDIAYIESLMYKLMDRTNEEIKTKTFKEKRSQYYYAQKIKDSNGKFNSYCLSKEYFDKKTKQQIRTDPKKCIFPFIEIPIVLNLLREANLKTTKFYKEEWQHKSKFYGTDENKDLPPQDEGFIEQMDDEVPF